MPNNVRVLANDEIVTSNQATEQGNFLNIPIKPKKSISKQTQALLNEIEQLKTENHQLKREIIEIGLEVARKINKDSVMWVV